MHGSGSVSDLALVTTEGFLEEEVGGRHRRTVTQRHDGKGGKELRGFGQGKDSLVWGNTWGLPRPGRWI